MAGPYRVEKATFREGDISWTWQPDARRDVQLRFDLRGFHGARPSAYSVLRTAKGENKFSPVLAGAVRGIYPMGVLFTLAPEPEASARITPDWSVKNIR